ncbi:MAG: methyltransferase [Pseudomonadales bacterium]|nr:methyltransferase [Pseudomonadales bacterium]
MNPAATLTGADTYSSAIAQADNYTRWIVDLCRPYIGHSLLEVGLGHGGFRSHLPRDIGYTGTDIDAREIDSASARHPEDRFLLADITSPEFASDVRALSPDVDTVLCANVLEHVENDRAAVAHMLAAAATGGKLLLYLPAHQSLFGTMDTLAGHHRRYDPHDLLRIADSARVAHWQLVNPIAALGWWVNDKIEYDSLDERGINNQIRWFNRYILPISRAVTPLTQRAFGLSLFCVIENT